MGSPRNSQIRSQPTAEPLEELPSENLRLIALLEANGIQWRRLETDAKEQISTERDVSVLGTDDKIALFRRLFRGRSDVYPIRWESKSTGKSGYAPACANEWRAGCPHEVDGRCSKINDLPCDPGMKGCELYGRYAFFDDSKNTRLRQKSERSASATPESSRNDGEE
jgi:hypothetical protein